MLFSHVWELKVRQQVLVHSDNLDLHTNSFLQLSFKNKITEETSIALAETHGFQLIRKYIIFQS